MEGEGIILYTKQNEDASHIWSDNIGFVISEQSGKKVIFK